MPVAAANTVIAQPNGQKKIDTDAAGPDYVSNSSTISEQPTSTTINLGAVGPNGVSATSSTETKQSELLDKMHDPQVNASLGKL